HSPEGTAINLGSTVQGAAVGATFTYNWQILKNNAPFATGTSSGINFTPDDNGAYQVTLIVDDSAGESASAGLTITIDNVAPTATFGNTSGTINEGSAAALQFTSPSDPSAPDSQ